MKALICDKPPDEFRKEWALRDLRGAAASAVRRVKTCSVKQLVGMERRSRTYGLSAHETLAAIYEGMERVPDPDLEKVKALRKQFPK